MRISIVGGGIVGLSTAYALSTEDVDVTLFEKNSLGAGSTERANGGIRAQFTSPSNLRLSTASLEVWENFESLFGVDIDFRQHGYLFLTTDETQAAQFEDNVQLQNDHGVPSEILQPSEIAERTDLRPAANIVAATYCSRDGYADPHSAVRGFADAARANGVRIRTNTPVTNIDRDADGYIISIPQETVSADIVVNAAGPWSPSVAAYVDVSLPITPVRRQLALIEPDRDVPASHPYTYHTEKRVSFRPERDQTTIVSGNFAGSSETVRSPTDYQTDIDRPFSIEALERLNDFSAYFGPGSKPTGGWCGLYSVTPDHNPIIDEPYPGFYVATGFSGHGFMHAPAVGLYLRNQIIGNTEEFLDADPYRLGRFEDGAGGEQLVL